MNKLIIIILLSATWLSVLKAQDEIPKSFSLKDAQDYAISHNKNVQNASLDVQIAQKKIWETTAIGLPQASATVGHNYFLELPQTPIPAKMFNPAAADGDIFYAQFGTENSTKMDFQVSQLIFSGEYIVGLKASKIYKQLSLNQLTKTEIDIKESIANTYQLVLVAEERLRIIDSNLIKTQELFNETEAMQIAGFSELTDVQQIKINLSRLTNARLAAERNIEVAKNLLKFQMDIPLENQIDLSDNLEGLLNQFDYKIIENQSFDNTQHIDYQMLETQKQLQHLNFQREKTTFLPTLSGFYSYSKQLQANDFMVFDNDAYWSNSSLVGLSLQIPVFSSGQRLSKVGQAKIEYEKASNQLSMVEENLNMQVLSARNAFKNAYDNYLLEKDNKELSEEIFDNYHTKYKNGMASSFELTQSQMQYLNTENAYFQAIFDLLDAKIKLDKALGILN